MLDKFFSDCSGKWHFIYNSLGINVGKGNHQPCPICGGEDRFRFDDNRNNGDYYCNQCGPGDGLALVSAVTGLEYKDCIKQIRKLIGGADIKPEIKTKVPDSKIKKYLNDLWSSSTALTGSDPVSVYLHSRSLNIRPDNVRYCAECYDANTKKNYPAMIAKVVSHDGVPAAIHRTYLNGAGKADIESPKKLTPTCCEIEAVRLFPISENEPKIIGVAEGIETAIAASQLWTVPVWSCISSKIMEKFVPPDGIKQVIVYGDNDSNYAGQRSAYKLANRLVNEGYIVDVEIARIGDFNDVLIDCAKERS